MTACTGHCYCGEVTIEATLSRPLSGFNPRKCDCEFCRLHNAAYISDPSGTLKIKSKNELGKFRQGSETAEFLFCTKCAVFVAVTFTETGKTFAAINAHVMNDHESFGSDLVVSPKKLNADEKTSRWKDVWFSEVVIE